MMLRILVILALICLSGRVALRAQTPETEGIDLQQEVSQYATLDGMLEEFYVLLSYESMEEKCAQMHSLIGSARDSLTRSHIAEKVFEHYRNSKIMGEEAVAIAVYDEWFASGRASFEGEFSKLEAELFVNFNRNSLLGMTAPQVELRKPCGGKMLMPALGRKAVLFFYDTACAKCRMEAKLLPAVLQEAEFELDFYAVYVGADKKAWREFRKELTYKNKRVRVLHLWDPQMDSDYQRMYGVIGTPRMFVVLEDGEILARRLEVENLKEVINYINIVNGQKKEK